MEVFDSKSTARRIEEILRLNLDAIEVEVEDQSHHHVGHHQAGGGGHFFVMVKSQKFAGLAPLARQRLMIRRWAH